ncbi:hypothetical protein BG005_008578 [Podila minutissima]|nr:hypothetical protein BG005_008578 [Podila minutissima]
MLRSASSLLALAVLCVQVALAKIETGYYWIVDNKGNSLGFGPVPPIWPPPDVPVRLFNPDSHPQKWYVEEAEGGLIIRAARDRESYRLVSSDDVVFVSFQKAPEPWAVTSVGQARFEIKAPYQDSVFTAKPEDEFQVQLRRAEGLPNQKWTFVPMDRYHRESRNRFCKQEQW